MTDPRSLTVFVSRTGEMAEYPQEGSFAAAALDGIRREGFVGVEMRDFTADPRPPAEVCEKAVRGCDIYLGLLGMKWGSPVRERPEISYTQLEFRTAQQAGEPCLVFLLDEKNAKLPPAAITDKNYERQLAFHQEVKDAGITCKPFANADQLLMLVRDALRPYRYSQRPPVDPSKYLARLSDQAAYIDIRGLADGKGKAHRLSVDELYMTLKITVSAEPDNEGERPDGSWHGLPGRADRRKNPQGQDGPATLASDEIEGHARGALELHEALPKHRRLAVVGDPGSGKTTALRRIAFLLCQTLLDRQATAAAEKLGLPDRPLPILVPLAELWRFISTAASRDLGPVDEDAASWLLAFFDKEAERTGTGADGRFFRDYLTAGTAILLLDGLDEAPTDDARAKLVALMGNLTVAYSDCRFLVTTRPAAKDDVAVLPGFAHAEINPLGGRGHRSLSGPVVWDAHSQRPARGPPPPGRAAGCLGRSPRFARFGHQSGDADRHGGDPLERAAAA